MKYLQNPFKVKHLDFLIVDRDIRYTSKGRFTEEDSAVIALYNFFGRWFSKQFIVDRISYIYEVSQKEGKHIPSYMDVAFSRNAFQELNELFINKTNEQNDDKTRYIDINCEIMVEINNLCHFNEPHKVKALLKYIIPNWFGSSVYLRCMNMNLTHNDSGSRIKQLPKEMVLFWWVDSRIPHAMCYVSTKEDANFRDAFSIDFSHTNDNDCDPDELGWYYFIRKDTNLPNVLNYSGTEYVSVFRMEGNEIVTCAPPLIRHEFHLMPLRIPGDDFCLGAAPKYFDKYYDLYHTGNMNARRAIEQGGFNLDVVNQQIADTSQNQEFLRQMLSNNFLGHHGYVDEPMYRDFRGLVNDRQLQSERWHIDDLTMTLQRPLPGIDDHGEFRPFDEEWQLIAEYIYEEHPLASVNYEDRMEHTDKYLEMFRNYYHCGYRGSGVEEYFQTQHHEINHYADVITGFIDRDLFERWLQCEYGIRDVVAFLNVLIDFLDADRGHTEELIHRAHDEATREYKNVQDILNKGIIWMLLRERLCLQLKDCLVRHYIDRTFVSAYRFKMYLRERLIQGVREIRDRIEAIGDCLSNMAIELRADSSDRLDSDRARMENMSTMMRQRFVEYYGHVDCFRDLSAQLRRD